MEKAYIKKILIPVIFASLFITFPSCTTIRKQQVVVEQQVSTAQELIENMKQYTMTEKTHHKGNLYEHCVWTALTLHKWFDTKNEWCQGLDFNKHNKKIMVLAGFLHDIGKAGDLKFTYLVKKDHPHIGCDYVLGNKKYKIDKQKTFNFDLFFKNLHISEEDRKLIAILIWNHHTFGSYILKGYQGRKNDTKAFDYFIDNLKTLVAQTNYNNGKVSEKLIRASILLSAADVSSVEFVNYKSHILKKLIGIDGSSTPPVRKGASLNRKHKFETLGKKVKKELLEYFDKNYEKNNS
jgi:hypothetical protein